MQAKLFLLIVIFVSTSCHAQEKEKSTEFQKVISLFPEEKIPFKYKNGIIQNNIKDINKEESMQYFHYSEEDLKMNNFLYNFDDDIKTDRWEDILPGALGKITKEKYVALIHAILKLPDIGSETYHARLTTFTYKGDIIDSLTVRSQYTPEVDYCDFVFLKNIIIRIFNYLPNLDNYNVRDGIYYIIDENAAKTAVEISDYQIDENGKINLAKTHPKQYLKEFVSYYRSYHADFDDPMNEY